MTISDSQPANKPEIVTLPAPAADQNDAIQADIVSLKQSTVSQVSAADVTVSDSIVRQVTSQQVTVSDSLVGLAQANQFSAQESFVMAANAGSAALNGVAGTFTAESAVLTDSRVGVLVGREVTGQNLQSTVLIAGKVNGSVTTLIDTRTAALFGLIMGVSMGIVMSLWRFIFRRNR